MSESVQLRAPRAARWSTTAVFALHAVIFAAWTPHIPAVKQHLGLTDGTLGLALLGAPFGSVCAMFVAGLAVSRWGSRPVVAVSLAGYALLSVGLGLAESWLGLFLALVVWGAFQSTLDIAMNAQAVVVENGYGRPVMSSFHAGWSLAGFCGAGLGTLAVSLGIGLTWQMLTFGLVIAAFAWPLTKPMLRNDIASEEHKFALPWRNRALVVLSALMFAGLFCEGAMGDWTALYLRESLHAPAQLAGSGYAVFAVAMFAGRAMGDWLVSRFGDHRVVGGLAGAGAVLFALALVIGSPWAALVGFVAFGLGLSCIVPVVYRAAAAVPGLHAGAAIAGASTAGWSGMLLGPPVIGLLSEASTLPLALGLLPLLSAVVALGARFLR
ncbi:MFS transporter [Kutzneria viridogrisea]|uniref:Major facilitator superfamily n=2 Tax=Kutzneria TaxID=43356 RepID=W5W8U1_9PSEU|nr:MFS transporter [Kutzneria albida]AHH97125.1 major facilitator superfamily [Kutzneria albida DSM 43870]MBA8931904.1 MFS family permease [Kutzneria viridogrisea]